MFFIDKLWIIVIFFPHKNEHTRYKQFRTKINIGTDILLHSKNET